MDRPNVTTRLPASGQRQVLGVILVPLRGFSIDSTAVFSFNSILRLWIKTKNGQHKNKKTLYDVEHVDVWDRSPEIDDESAYKRSQKYNSACKILYMTGKNLFEVMGPETEIVTVTMSRKTSKPILSSSGDVRLSRNVMDDG